MTWTGLSSGSFRKRGLLPRACRRHLAAATVRRSLPGKSVEIRPVTPTRGLGVPHLMGLCFQSEERQLLPTANYGTVYNIHVCACQREHRAEGGQAAPSRGRVAKMTGRTEHLDLPVQLDRAGHRESPPPSLLESRHHLFRPLIRLLQILPGESRKVAEHDSRDTSPGS